MADPLSVAASIAGLVSLASDVVGLCFKCYEYQKSVRNAPEAIQKVADELKVLGRVLRGLESVYQNRTTELPSLAALDQEVARCKSEIDKFETRLQRNTRDLSLAAKLKWPLKEKDVASFIERLQRFCVVFSAAQATDTLNVSMQSLSLLEDITQSMASRDAQAASDDITAWLSPLDFSQRQQELFTNRRHPRTGGWILREPQFHSWRSGSPNPVFTSLFLKGIPGSGKTILWQVFGPSVLSQALRAWAGG